MRAHGEYNYRNLCIIVLRFAAVRVICLLAPIFMGHSVVYTLIHTIAQKFCMFVFSAEPSTLMDAVKMSDSGTFYACQSLVIMIVGMLNSFSS